MQAQDIVKRNRDSIAEIHRHVDSYYENAESEQWLDVFWGEQSPFKQRFRKLNLSNVLELACGHGRHIEKYKEDAGHIYAVDILQENIDYCKIRFKDETNITYINNKGYDFATVPDNCLSAVFTYDAMVHFEMMDVFSYLKETERCLIEGGLGLFHHSNNTEDYRITYETGTQARNYMSKDLFAYLSNRAGLEIIDQFLIDWGGNKDLDCISLVRKIKI